MVTLIENRNFFWQLICIIWLNTIRMYTYLHNPFLEKVTVYYPKGLILFSTDLWISGPTGYRIFSYRKIKLAKTGSRFLWNSYDFWATFRALEKNSVRKGKFDLPSYSCVCWKCFKFLKTKINIWSGDYKTTMNHPHLERKAKEVDYQFKKF